MAKHVKTVKLDEFKKRIELFKRHDKTTDTFYIKAQVKFNGLTFSTIEHPIRAQEWLHIDHEGDILRLRDTLAVDLLRQVVAKEKG